METVDNVELPETGRGLWRSGALATSTGLPLNFWSESSMKRRSRRRARGRLQKLVQNERHRMVQAKREGKGSRLKTMVWHSNSCNASSLARVPPSLEDGVFDTCLQVIRYQDQRLSSLCWHDQISPSPTVQ